MGNSSSKRLPKAISKNIPKTTTMDEKFGHQIMQNIQLKESSFIPINQNSSKLTGLAKRIELNKRTDGTISWNELPLIFSENQNKLKIDKTKIEEIKKHFSFPTDKQQIIKK